MSLLRPLGLSAIFAALLFLNSLGAAAGSRFTMRLTTDPSGFDWQLASTTMDTYVAMNIMEGLVAYDDGLRVVPALAQHWDVSADRRVYTFHLKPNVKWSDGQALEAKHFVDSFERLRDPKTAAPYGDFLSGVESMKAKGPAVLEVRLKKPIAHFLHLLTFWVTFPIRKDLMAMDPKGWAEPGKMVVVGPFVPESYQPQSELVLKRNARYHGARPALETVVMRIVGENSTAINLFRSKQLDFVNQVDLTELGTLAQGPDFHQAPYHRLYFLAFNTKKPPFDDAKARQAVALSIDRRRIPALFKGTKRMAESLIPEGWVPGLRAAWPTPDAGKAKTLLKEAGVRDAYGLTVDLLADSSEENSMVTQFLQQEMKRSIGVEPQISLSEFRTFRSRIRAGEGAMALRRWGADFPDPDTFLGMFLSDSGNNLTGWKNTAYDRLVEQMRALPPGAERNRLVGQALELLLEKDCVVLPLYFDAQLYLLNPRVGGFKINPLNYVYLKDAVIQ